MKRLIYFVILILALSACKDDVLRTGASVLPEQDAIVVNVDTFSLASSLQLADYIYSSPDSMLLGECDSRFGTIHADILTQLACPEGYKYEEGAQLDSVCLFIMYKTWFGDGKSPMSLKVYEMDKETFYYTNLYRSDIDVSEYWSGEDSTQISERNKILVASEPTDSSSAGGYYVRIKARDSFAKRFFMIRDFSSQENYSELFKGIYITSEFGSSVMLNVSEVSLAVFYHFTYSRLGKDTTVYNEKWFYANSEIRSVNSISYSNTDFYRLLSEQDSVCYVVSPANLSTRLSIPMLDMSSDIRKNIGEKRPYVNMAKLQVDVLNVYTGQTSQKTSDDWAQPADNMMLIKESAAERFFKDKELPQDTCAIISPLITGTDSLGNTTHFYTYDLKTLLTRQLRQTEETDTLHMLLLPVSVEYSSTSSTTTVSAVHPLQTITATTVRSAADKANPMTLEVVYSGF